jgi:hypothetical protein
MAETVGFLPDFGYAAHEIAIIVLVMIAAGVVKGVIAFAFPVVVVALLANVIDPAKAIALGVLPGLTTNAVQVRRRDLRPVIERFWLLILAMIAAIVIGAAVAAWISKPLMLVLLGAMTLAVSIFFAVNPRVEIAPRWRKAASLPFALTSGFFGGLTTVFGPPIVMYFVAIRVSRDDFASWLSLIYTIGWVVIVVAFGATGFMSQADLALSVLLVAPALFGLWMGEKLRRRIDQELFRRLVLIGLGLSGARLILANVQSVPGLAG